MAFLIGGANTLDDGGYTIDNSLRMNDADNAYLNFTPGSDGDLDKWTLSMWIKRTTISTYDYTFTVEDAGGGNNTVIVFYNDDGVRFEHYDGSQLGMLITNRKFRDPSAWYHLVFVWDTGNGTAGNRQRMYINGVEETSFATDTNPSSGRVSFVNDASYVHWIGRGITQSEANNFDGYLAEVAFCDGQTYTPSDFGEFDEDSGIWKPKKLGVTFGSQGYYLEFKGTGTSADASGIGADTSGQDNHWAVTNLAATDVTTDTPTNSFATMNPLDAGAEATLSEGNLKYAGGTTSGQGPAQVCAGGFGVSNGKWYWEVTKKSNEAMVGILAADHGAAVVGSSNPFGSALSGESHSIYTSDGNARSGNASTSYGSAINDDDIIGIALDMDNGAIYYSDNGTFMNSGDPTSGASKTGAASNFTAGGTYLLGWIADGASASSSVYEFNFGNPIVALSSGNADANGYGNFEYAPPSGYYAPCTKNLAEYG